MEKIIIKLENSFNGNSGIVLPFFSVNNNSYEAIRQNDFPNNGKIFVMNGIENFAPNSFYIFEKDKLSPNPIYETQLKEFDEGISNRNPSQNLLKYSKANVKKLLPIDLIKVYPISFSLETRKLNNVSVSGIDTDVFFLESNDDLYGPFKRNHLELSPFSFESDRDEFGDSDEYLDFLDLYNENEYDGEVIFKIKKEDVSNVLISDSNKGLYLTDFKSIVNHKIGDPLIFLDNSNLIDWGKKKILKLNPQAKLMINLINPELSKKDSNIEKLKWERFKELLVDEIGDNEAEKIKEILSQKGILKSGSDEKFKVEIDNLIKKHEEELENKNTEIIKLKDENTTLNLRQQIIPITEPNEYNFDSFPEIKKAITQREKLEDTLKGIESVEYYRGQLTIFKDQVTEEKNNLEKLKEDKNNLKEEKNKIIAEFAKTKENLSSEIVKTKILTDLLNGIDVVQNKKVDIIFQNPPNIIKCEKPTAREYIQDIRDRLKTKGRDLTFNDVANLIITVNQSFLTILAGAPGIGKTSLVDKFSKSLGLSEKFGYLEISCAKGWSSSKDLIGFYNPLTNKFQSSRTKLKDALMSSSEYKDSLYMVLLDEANLSPMEHYWSDFIKLADFDYARTIKISDSETIEFGEGFRFLATINHDHTTEILSNRLIDRASIIQIEKPNYEDKRVESNSDISEILDFNSIESLFKDTSRWKSEESTLMKKINEITRAIESNHSGLIVSPRKLNAVINYIKVATGLLDGNDYVALDYAIAQQVFPLINLRGENHHETLRNLMDSLHGVGMTKSHELLTRIVERGKEFKHFKYIYY